MLLYRDVVRRTIRGMGARKENVISASPVSHGKEVQ